MELPTGSETKGTPAAVLVEGGGRGCCPGASQHRHPAGVQALGQPRPLNKGLFHCLTHLGPPPPRVLGPQEDGWVAPTL